MTDMQQQAYVQFWIFTMDTNYIYLLQGKNRIIPLAWEFSCANEHDSQKIELLYRAWIYRAKILIADRGYHSEKWLKAAQELERLVKNFVISFHSVYCRAVIYCNYIF